jgi:hypothetical protein
MIKIYTNFERGNILFWIFFIVGFAFLSAIFIMFLLPFVLLAGLFFFLAFYIKYRRFFKTANKGFLYYN